MYIILKRSVMKSESSHVNHIGLTIIIFLFGGLVGYYTGAAYATDGIYQAIYDQSFFYGAKKHTTAVVATSASDPTADWKVYSNDSMNFSFKYPKTYTATVSTTDQTVTVVSTTGTYTAANAPKDYRHITFSYKPSDITVDHEHTISTARDVNPNIGLTSATAATADGGKANIYETTSIAGAKTVDAFVTNGTNRYYFTTLSGVASDVYAGQLTLLKQILSTFKFTK